MNITVNQNRWDAEIRQIRREFEMKQFQDKAYNHLKYTKSPHKTSTQGRRVSHSTPPSYRRNPPAHADDNKKHTETAESDDNERMWTKVPMPSTRRPMRIMLENKARDMRAKRRAIENEKGGDRKVEFELDKEGQVC